MRKALVLVGMLAVAPLLGSACAIVLGVQDDTHAAAAVICSCEPWQGALPNCQSDVEGRLTGAPSDVRTQWLQDFGNKCMLSCPDMFTCFYEPPVCTSTGSPCGQPLECCSYFPNNDLTACQPHGVCK
jgi:hypothetical protein